MLILFMLLSLVNISNAQISTTAYVTADDVTIYNLESNRVILTDAINSGDGSLIQAGTISASTLDANANPENRWNEGFNDFVFRGLTIPTSASLSSTTASGIAYVNGSRVVKDSTAKEYTASKWTWVDLSSTGTYTYSEVAIGGSEPSVATNSIRLARVSSDATTISSVSDERVTQINIAAGSAGSLADTDADTTIQTEESTDEDILRFDIGDATLSSATEAFTVQAIDTTNIKIEPGTDNIVDLGSSSKEFRDLYIDGTVTADAVTAGSFISTSGTFTIGANTVDFDDSSDAYVLTFDTSTDRWYGAGTFPNLFTWSGSEEYGDTTSAQVLATSLTPTLQTDTGIASEGYSFFATDTAAGNIPFLHFKFKKTKFVSTITVHTRIWSRTAGTDAELQIDVGGQTLEITRDSQTPGWATLDTIDVSGLTDGTVYSGTIQLDSENAGVDCYCSAVTLTGS